jgi:hypothetical protein
MKKTFFFFAMFASVAASAQVTHVEPVGANYANQTVSFRVWWNAGSRDATHLSKVWVWVDYIQVNANNTTSGNTWTRATVGSVSGGTTSFDGSNRKGFWLEGNATTNYSATLTVKLTNVPTKFNWCAYVSDYPPNVTVNNGTYTFKGTPPFTLSNGTVTQTVSGKTLTASALTVIPTTIRDKTECPGVFCPYQGSDLYIDVTHLCQQRTSGAKNWEAYIKDVRDDQIYHIVQFADGTWWFADYLTTTDKRKAICSLGVSLYSPIDKPACPSGWTLPTTAQIHSRWTNGTSVSDPYGGGLTAHERRAQDCGGSTMHYCENHVCTVWLITAECNNVYVYCANGPYWTYNCGPDCNATPAWAEGVVRCFRQL